ncbi:MAG: hypothetical protein RLY16_2232 [Bacteroidota bacterium]|jgi:hypothetical protein
MKKVILPICLFITGLLVQVVAQAQTAEEIIEKYIAAIGGADNVRKINSMKVTGHVEVQGIEIPFDVAAVNGKGFRTDAEFQGNKIIDIVTPTKGWSQNPFAGKTSIQPLTDDELKEKLDELDIQDAFVDYAAKGSTIESLGKDEEDGNEYFKIKLTTKNKNESVYYFDLKTNLIYKRESIMKQEGQEIKMTAKNFDYQFTEIGVKIPFKVDQGGMVMVYKTVTFNVPVDEKIFSDK